MVSWDTIIAIVIIVGLILAIWSRISHQTIPELLGGMTDLLKGGGEEVYSEVVTYNE